jgi:hypothetical protein
MARRSTSKRSTTVGLAVDRPALRRAALEILAADGRYHALPFSAAEIASGAWPAASYAAVVATPAAFRARRRRPAGGSNGTPVILIVREREIVREKAALAAADAFVLAEGLNSLPSIVVLARYRLSIMPKPVLAALRPPRRPRTAATKRK